MSSDENVFLKNITSVGCDIYAAIVSEVRKAIPNCKIYFTKTASPRDCRIEFNNAVISLFYWQPKKQCFKCLFKPNKSAFFTIKDLRFKDSGNDICKSEAEVENLEQVESLVKAIRKSSASVS